jgi:bifunctional DNase/RNase
MLKAVTISSLNVDPASRTPYIILKEIEGKQILPIWVGLLEATAIASEIQGLRFSRPMTHDLLKTIIDMTDSRVNRVEICDLRDNTYYALIQLTNRGRSLSVDSRPSDAIALAVKSRAPIFVSEELLRRYEHIEATQESLPAERSEQGKKWQDILEKLKPEDFGKYKM